jgi:uncharacterized protein
MAEDEEQPPESLLPYNDWTEEALHHVVVSAIRYAAEHGLPGEHHFYLTFRTDHPGTVIPPRLRAQYPQVMTIVLQHQFWDLNMDEEAGLITVGLSFGGVPASLAIPLAAVTAFADPHVRFGLQFRTSDLPVEEPEAPDAAEPGDGANAAEETAAPPPAEEPPQVVSLDAFRRRTPPKP